MLRRIGLLNFKCFERLDLPCARLNLLCGLNGMGKSSVIQALLVLRQSFRTGGLLEGRLILGGTLTDLGADAVVAGFKFDRAGDAATRRYRTTNVGFGLSYVLPVVLGLLALPGTSTCSCSGPRPWPRRFT